MFENRAAAVTSPSASRVRSVDLPKRQRARRTNDPFAGIDTNTARGRRIADVRAYLLALGSPPEIERWPWTPALKYSSTTALFRSFSD
jgi:hypothetical protein